MNALVAIWIVLAGPVVGIANPPSDGQVALARLDALYNVMRESESMHIQMVIGAFSSDGASLEDFPMTYRIDVCGASLSYQSEGFTMLQDQGASLQVHDQPRQMIYRHAGNATTFGEQSTMEDLIPVSVQQWSKACDSVRARTTGNGDHEILFYYPTGPWVTASVTVDESFSKLLRADAIGRGSSPQIAHYTVEFQEFSYACEAPSKDFDFTRFVLGEGLDAQPTTRYAEYDFVNLTPR